MCFSPKVKIPKPDPVKIAAPEPAPLAEQVKGVEFGGSTNSEDDTKDTEGTSSEVKSSSSKSGKSSLRIKLDTNKATSGAKKSSIKSRMGK